MIRNYLTECILLRGINNNVTCNSKKIQRSVSDSTAPNIGDLIISIAHRILMKKYTLCT